MKQRAFLNLPENYRPIRSVDLQKNKKEMLLVNGIALAIGVLMAVPMHFAVSIGTLFDMSEGLLAYGIRFVVMLAGMIAYIVLHEAVHGIAMKGFGCKKVRFGFTGMYAYAGCDEYFDKLSYLVIALAPVVVWGVVLGVIQCFVPVSWLWVVYLIQITNISGAAGDLYVFCLFSKLPKDILVKDVGTSMTVYSAE